MTIEVDSFPYNFSFKGFPNDDIYKDQSTEDTTTTFKIDTGVYDTASNVGVLSHDNVLNDILKNFTIKECGGGGECQFLSIENALMQSNNKYTHTELRNLIADYILNKLSDDDFNNIINSYKIEKENNEFIGEWDPYLIKSKNDFIKEIKQPGFHFQGDDVTLSLLSSILNIDFYIINKKNHSIFKISNKINNNNIIILYYIPGITGHYQLIGLNKMFLFDKDNLPNDVLALINYYRKTISADKTPQFELSQAVTINNFHNKECGQGYGGWKLEELRTFCKIVNISTHGNKQELCARIKEYIKSKEIKKPQFEPSRAITIEKFHNKECGQGYGGWKLEELRTFCKIVNISTHGNKQELCARIKEYIKSKEIKKPQFEPSRAITIEKFHNKECGQGYGGWKLEELRTFCKIVNISTHGNKQELCARINEYIKSINKVVVEPEVDQTLSEEEPSTHELSEEQPTQDFSEEDQTLSEEYEFTEEPSEQEEKLLKQQPETEESGQELLEEQLRQLSLEQTREPSREPIQEQKGPSNYSYWEIQELKRFNDILKIKTRGDENKRELINNINNYFASKLSSKQMLIERHILPDEYNDNFILN